MSISTVRLEFSEGQTFQVPQGRTEVGRMVNGGLKLKSRLVSRMHAILDRTDTAVWLTDAGSTNGTFVNEQRLDRDERRALAAGDSIGFAKPKIAVIHGNATPATDVDEFGFQPSGEIRFEQNGFPERAVDKLNQRFRPLKIVAAGGMGKIILCQEIASGRFVAVKVMLDSALRSSKHVHQFIREAVITARLEHPHIVPVYDIGFLEDSQLYYSMRYVEGKSLRHIQSSLDLAERLRILRTASLAVMHAHSKGLWHRDLKPHHIMVGPLGDVYVIDWGLVSVEHGVDYKLELPQIVVGSEAYVIPDNLIQATGDALTVDGPGIMGTPAYMAPEQWENDYRKMGATSDVWAFGIMLFEALTNRHPLGKVVNVLQFGAGVVSETFPTASDLNPHAPIELCVLCSRMLAKDPTERLNVLGEFTDEVTTYLKSNTFSLFQMKGP